MEMDFNKLWSGSTDIDYEPANRMSGLLHLSPATCGKYMAMYKDWEAQNQNAE